MKGKDGKADPKKAAAQKAPPAGKDKPKEEEAPKVDEGPKYKFGKFKQDGDKGDAGALLRPKDICHCYFLRTLYC